MARSPREALDDLIEAAEQASKRKGAVLTPLRRRVLEAMADSGKPMKVYDLIDLLRQPEGRVYPASAYRAMDFLEEAGLVRRVESLSAYVLCWSGGSATSTSLFICERCRRVSDVPGDAHAEDPPEGFRVMRSVIEHYGLCAACDAEDQARLKAS